jgi:hypothetical protein
LTKKNSRWRRRALIGAGVVAVGVPGLWLAIHEIPGFGPLLADGARAVFGPRAVAWAEDVSYDVQDRINQWRYKDTAPKTFWEAPSGAPAAPSATPVASASASPAPSAQASAAPAVANAPAAPDSAFPPPAFTPPYKSVATEGEGAWVPMKDNGPEGQPPVMVKSFVHPDTKRGFAAVAVVAIDLRRADLHLVAGSQEPASPKIPSERRPGIVPKEALPDLFAAFNGGFKAIHGHWGMMLAGETFVAPRDIGCTVALFKDGSIKIRSWPALKDAEASMSGYRQTPPCLVEDGKTPDALENVEYNRNWGATVSGETVIRRSAVGLDKSGRVLFYGLGEAVTAQALSHAMRAVGAESAAQLDVNYSYPRFLTYERSTGDEAPRVAGALIPGIKYQKSEYVGVAEIRDFFYLTRRRPSSS